MARFGESDSVSGILTALGAYLGRPSYWAHDALAPCFTERRMA
ncbi:hypothetical protein ABH920_005836 [Catenulispora sp. EB89]